MTQNTIYNKSLVSSVKYNMRFGVDDPNNLDIFTKPTTDGATAQQLSDFTYRSWSVNSYVGTDVKYCETNARSVTYNNGASGVGATVTNAGTATPLVIDGGTVALGETFALGGQASAFQNGLFTLTTAGNAWVGTRMTEYDSPSEMGLGTFFNVTNGTNLAGKKFVQVNANFTTVGTSAVLFRTPGSVLLSSINAVYFLGAYNMISTLAGDCFPTFPAGTYTLAAQSANVTFGTIAANSVTFNDGTGLKTTHTAGEKYYLSYYDTDAAADIVFGTATAGTVPTFNLAPPSGGLVTISKSVGTGGTNITPSGLLTSNFSQVLNVTTGETDLMTYSLPANTFVTTNQVIEHKFRGQFTSSVNAKTLKIYFGTTVIITNSLPTSTAGNYFGTVSIIRTGASTQAYSYEFIRTVSTGTAAAPPLTGSGTCAETETAGITMKLTGTGGASSEISQTYAAIQNHAG